MKEWELSNEENLIHKSYQLLMLGCCCCCCKLLWETWTASEWHPWMSFALLVLSTIEPGGGSEPGTRIADEESLTCLKIGSRKFLQECLNGLVLFHCELHVPLKACHYQPGKASPLHVQVGGPHTGTGLTLSDLKDCHFIPYIALYYAAAQYSCIIQ